MITMSEVRPAPDQVRQYLETGENERVEFKERIVEPPALARYLSAFANADGGAILVGIQEPNVIIGCDMAAVEQVYVRALAQLHPRPATTLQAVPLGNTTVAMIKVAKSSVVVSASDGVFIRRGATTRALSALEIQDKLGRPVTDQQVRNISEVMASLTQHAQQQTLTIEQQATTIERLTDTVQRIDERTADGEKLPSKFKNDVRSNMVGAGLTAMVGGMVLHSHQIVEFMNHLIHAAH